MASKQDKAPVWITPEHGLLIMMPRPALMAWGGVEQPRNGRVIEARSRWREPDAPATDFDRACDVPAPIGVIEVNGRHALVLNDAPQATTWIPRSTGGVIVRGAGGDSRPPALPSRQTLDAIAWEPLDMTVTSREASWMLFDAACPGWEIDLSCALSLHPGTYSLWRGTHENTRYPLQLIRLDRTV
jgi:hypothetical protein